jgi:hypothetical protein
MRDVNRPLGAAKTTTILAVAGDKDRCPRCFGKVFQVLSLDMLTGVGKVDKDRCPRCFGKVIQALILDILTGIGKVDKDGCFGKVFQVLTFRHSNRSREGGQGQVPQVLRQGLPGAFFRYSSQSSGVDKDYRRPRCFVKVLQVFTKYT